MRILEEEEIKRLSGRSRPDAQARALSAMGIPYRVRPDGAIIVIDEDLPLSRSREEEPKVVLNLDAA